MTLVPYLPQWLARRLAPPQPRKVANPNMKQWQLLPTLPAPQHPRKLLPDDAGHPGYRIQWHL